MTFASHIIPGRSVSWRNVSGLLMPTPRYRFDPELRWLWHGNGGDAISASPQGLFVLCAVATSTAPGSRHPGKILAPTASEF